MYRQRHGQISPVNVVKFLVLDREFPRAVLHCLTRANESLHAISGTVSGRLYQSGGAAAGPAAGRARLHPGRGRDLRRTARIRRQLSKRLNLVGEAIFDSFFAMRPLDVGVNRPTPASTTHVPHDEKPTKRLDRWSGSMTFCLGMRVNDGVGRHRRYAGYLGQRVHHGPQGFHLPGRGLVACS